MPLFEYRCRDCGKKSVLLMGPNDDRDSAACEHCGSRNVVRLVSRFSRARSEDSRIEELSDMVEAMPDPDSPSQMRGMLKEMGKALDEDFSEEMEEMFEADQDGLLDDDE